MKTKIKLIMAMFAIMLVSVTSAFAYTVDDLVAAVVRGKFDTVKACVEAGVDVNGRDSDGSTALLNAAMFNQTKIMKYLISKGASVDRGSSKGYFPIGAAAYEGHLEAVKILVYNGCDVNKLSYNTPPLQDAQEQGHTQIVKFLKEHGAR